ncbi:PIG-L family deacetylase [Streptomyces sp. NPDC001937]
MTDRSGPDCGSGGLRRRSVVRAAAAAALMGVGACSVPTPRRRGPMADPAPGLPVAGPRPTLMMQILAHPDDDLYFMNPDTQQALAAGTPLVCVYLTAGESFGLNKIPGRARPAPDRAAYSSARHQGLRQTYAAQLGLPMFTRWHKSVLGLAGGHRAEINTLLGGGRRVELIFLNTAMQIGHGRLGLPSLWHDRALNLRTVVAADSPLERVGAYTYDGLIDVLVGLLDRYRPTVVHTLDPDPDIQHSTEAVRRQDIEQPGYSDHADHTATASFAWAALIRWVARATQDGGGVPRFVTTAFRGYYNRHWPKNLPGGVLKEKAAHLIPYGGDADWRCGNRAGCGDYNVGGDRPLTNRKGWVRSTRYRYPGPRPTVTTEPDGRLAVYGVLGLRVVRWRESAPGSGAWDGPDDLGGGPFAPVLGRAVTADGRLFLFGLRFAALGGHGAQNEREVVLLEQSSRGGAFRAWRGLGNPEPAPDRGRRIGVPVAVTAPDGRVHLFVRNADKGVSTRVRGTSGRWGEWLDLGGGEVQDGLSAVVDGHGLIHVYGAGHHAVHHWAQETPGARLTARREIDGAPVPGDGPAARITTDGSVELLYRAAARARLTAVTGGTAVGRTDFDGYGPVSVADSPLGPVLLGRTEEGRLQLRTGERLSVRMQGPVALDGPALYVTGLGRPTVVGLGPDADPWLWRP